MNTVVFSSKSNEWNTPKGLFDQLNSQFNFIYDAACTTENCLCSDGFYVDKGIDALSESWPKTGWIFCNPPYGREVSKFIKKAYEESLQGADIVLLIPARPDTSYWHDYIFGKAEIWFIKSRLKFSDSKTNAPFPSAVVIYHGKKTIQ